MKVRRIVKWSAPFAIVLAVVAWGFVLQRRTQQRDLFEEALTALRTRKLERVAEIERVLDRDERSADHARLLRGALLLRRQEYVSALEELSRVAPAGELRELVLEFTGEALYRMGRLAEAESVLRQLADENPDHVDAHRWLGSIYYDLGANNLALAELTIVTRLVPTDYRPHWLMAEMYFDFEQNKESAEHYRKALANTPPPAVRQVILRKLAKTQIAERQFQAALATLEASTRSAETLAMIGECHWSLGDRKRADEAVESARKANPNERAVLYLEARMLIGDGRPDAAVAPLKRILAADPRDAQARYQLSLVYRRLGRGKEAEEELARWKASKTLFERLTKLNVEAIRRPQDAKVRDELADICEQLGKHNLAVMWRIAADACRKVESGRKTSPSADP